MIDPLVSMAFAVHANKGAYALLLGSGISRASGIPTGWEVVIDLVRKVAKLEGDDCEPDPAAWFRHRHGAEPDYSKLLDGIAKTPTERQQLLRGYFEPTEAEHEQKAKLPSAAHKAIAQLVARGYFRVIVTTNFDRLLEKALEEAGVTTTVVSTADQLVGALPLAHSGATVIKLHGDYLDTRIRNTESELASYDQALDGLLDRIFDEYGLIVSGWSGDWDIALRAAIERCPNRRFTTFWTTQSPLGERARALAMHRQAVVLQIDDANQLFETLHEKVQALEDLAAPHPLSAKMAAATVKRYLVDPSAKIRLRDLIHVETEKLFLEINAPAFAPQSELQPAEELNKRVAKYGALCETLVSTLVTGCYWGTEDQMRLWVQTLQRIANPNEYTSGTEYLLSLRRYPALLLLYSTGLAALAGEKYETLQQILFHPQARGDNRRNQPIVSVLYPVAVLERGLGRSLPGMGERATPVNDHLYESLRSVFKDYLPSDEEYQLVFDRFEYLLGVVFADTNRKQVGSGWGGPHGRFIWKDYHDPKDHPSLWCSHELEAHGSDFPLLKAGAFGGSVDQMKTALDKYNVFLVGVQNELF